jgi:hypothetical protein
LEKVGQGVYGGGGHGLRVTVNVFGPARWMSKIWNSRGGITTAIRVAAASVIVTDAPLMTSHAWIALMSA